MPRYFNGIIKLLSAYSNFGGIGLFMCAISSIAHIRYYPEFTLNKLYRYVEYSQSVCCMELRFMWEAIRWLYKLVEFPILISSTSSVFALPFYISRQGGGFINGILWTIWQWEKQKVRIFLKDLVNISEFSLVRTLFSQCTINWSIQNKYKAKRRS